MTSSTGLFTRPFSKPSEEQMEAELVSDFFFETVKAAAYLFLRCPAVIEAFILHWMKAGARKTIRDPDDGLKDLLATLVNHDPCLSLTFHHTVDPLGRDIGRTADIALFMNYAVDESEGQIYCDEDTLLQYVAASGLVDRNQIETRLTFLIMALIVYKGKEGFRIERVGVNNLFCTYTNFGSNALLNEHHDHSAFFICAVNFIVDYLHSVVTTTEASEAEFQTAIDLLALVDRKVRSLRDWASWILTEKDEVMEPLYVYEPHQHDEENFIFGIPAQVLRSESTARRSLLWLEWAWRRPVVAAKEKEAAEGEEILAHGLREKINNLWRAKSLLMWSDYHRFFYDWDREQLLPLASQVVDQMKQKEEEYSVRTTTLPGEDTAPRPQPSGPAPIRVPLPRPSIGFSTFAGGGAGDGDMDAMDLDLDY
jgi:hypothetical protein